MAQLSDIDKIRKKRRRKVILGRALLLLLLTCAGVAVYAVKDEVSAAGITNFFQDKVVSAGRGSGYPMDFAGDQLRGTYAVDNNLAVLTDSNLYFYNDTGKEIRSIQHKYSNPVVRVNGRRILLYDRGGKKLRVESLSRTLGQKELEYPIYAGTISSRGEVAVATGAQRRLSEMSVYDHLLTEPAKYKFKSAENYITDLEFSKNGKEIAVASVNVGGGELVSTLQTFKLDKEDHVGETKLAGDLIHSLSAVDGGFSVITDKRTLLFSPACETLAEYDYNYRVLASFDCGETGYTALFFGDYRESQRGELVLLGEDGAELWRKEVSVNAEHLRVCKGQVVIVVDGELQSCDLAGTPAGKRTLGKEAFALQQAGGALYVVTPSSIEKIEMKVKV